MRNARRSVAHSCFLVQLRCRLHVIWVSGEQTIGPNPARGRLNVLILFGPQIILLLPSVRRQCRRVAAHTLCCSWHAAHKVPSHRRDVSRVSHIRAAVGKRAAAHPYRTPDSFGRNQPSFWKAVSCRESLCGVRAVFITPYKTIEMSMVFDRLGEK